MESAQEDKTVSDIRKSNKLSKIITTFGLLLMGALGSGLWETIFSPLLFWIYKTFIGLIGIISKTYINNLYETISNGFHENYSFFFYITYWAILTGLYIYLFDREVLKEIRKNRKQNQKSKFFNNIDRKYILTLLVIFILFYSILEISRSVFINDTITKTIANIEIVSPYISDNEYKMLKSKFFSMKSQDDYKLIVNILSDISKKNGIIIKK